MYLKSIILEQAVSNILPQLESQNDFKNNWEKLPEKILLKELTLCLLSSSVKYEMACLYIEKMESLLLFTRWISETPNYLDIFKILSSPVLFNDNMVKYRFPKLKSKQLFSLLINIYGKGESLKSILKESSNPVDVRKEIVNKCNGIGNKQSSMFLRNIGFTNKLAILDTHLIDYLKCLNIIPLNASLNTSKRYFQIEKQFFDYAHSRSYNTEILDFAIWSVMKVYKREFI